MCDDVLCSDAQKTLFHWVHSLWLLLVDSSAPGFMQGLPENSGKVQYGLRECTKHRREVKKPLKQTRKTLTPQKHKKPQGLVSESRGTLWGSLFLF